MTHGIINLSVVPIRLEPSDTSEMVTQALFGELLSILETQQQWIKIRLNDDGYEGWMDKKMMLPLAEEEFEKLKSDKQFLTDFITFVFTQDETPVALPIGVQFPAITDGKFQLGKESFMVEAEVTSGILPKKKIVEMAHLFLNTPYLWGGKSIFGIDCSGFTQLVYKICGYSLPRDAYQQAEKGEPLSFIEEAEAGDLAFFDNENGKIIHVGIILSENRIIHAHGKVRIDHIDYSGIFNAEQGKHTHRLRVIKKIIA